MKRYLIIGSSSGIGLSTTNMLSNSNKIYATYNTTEPTISSENVQHIKYDINNDFPIDELDDTIDGLVYCPGSIDLKPFRSIKEEAITNDFNIQVLGAVRVIQQLIKGKKFNDNASIVLFSSVAVQQGLPYHTIVSISKGAIEGLTRALAAEFAPKIRVNAIAPSLTNTPLASGLLNSDQKIEANGKRHPLQRIGQPEDIANAVEYLLTDKSSWMTGQILGIDGGMSSLKL